MTKPVDDISAKQNEVPYPRRPPLCVGCGEYDADPPSDLCPGCEAYKEHTGGY